MGSGATTTTDTETNNLALDASSTNGEGVQILDSIIVDPSDTVMIETIKQHRATFEVMTHQNTIQLENLLTLGSEIIKLADNQSIRMDDFAYKQLESGLEYLKHAKERANM